MKRVISSLLIALVAISPMFAFAGCGKMVTPVAYVQFKTEGKQVVVYTAYANSSDPHIYVYDEESDIPVYNGQQPVDYRRECEFSCALYISFKRNLGEDKEHNALVCDIDKWQSMTITIWKDRTTYGKDKRFYLNDKELVVGQNKIDSFYDDNHFAQYYFEDFGLKRSNPNGRFNNFINIIEYK